MHPGAPRATPIVGRERELETLEQLRLQAARGEGVVLLVSGDGGIGKTRLVSELARSAAQSGWHVMVGRAYALEASIPYAPFADACEPALTAMDGNLLLRLTRGDRAVLTALAPSRGGSATAEARASGASAAEQRLRLHAGILQLFTRLSERQPLLLVLENLQWADDSSVELLHFLARQVAPHRLLLVGTWNETERPLPDSLRTMVRSVRALGVARDLRLEPLTAAALGQLVTQRFDVSLESVAPFVGALHDATRGNPFFVEQMLEELISRGTLKHSGSVWVGWHLEHMALPHSVRDVLQARLERLRADARGLADVIAVSGTAIGHEVLRVAVRDLESPTDGMDDTRLLAALDELRLHGIVVEQVVQGAITYDVAHPMLRQALIDAVGLARERTMHARIATALESAHAEHADRYAEQIAAHWRLADPAANTRNAVRWLLLAGRQAMERLARREAAAALQAALDRADEYPEAVDADIVPVLLDELARLYRRLGEYHHVIAMCTRARDLATRRHDDIGVAIAERRLGLANEGLGRRREAVQHFDAGIARAASDTMLLARLRLAKGDSLQALGQPHDARREIAQALELAEQRGDVELLARAHRSLLKLHTWSGPAHRAWAHARSAVELAERSGARNLAWSAHWTAAVLGGFTSNISALQHHLARATSLADELRSPLLQLRTVEISIEFHSGTSNWDRALVEGELAIANARALDQTTLLARLLYWVGSVYLYRGETAEAQRLFDEAWIVSGADAVDLDQPFEVHGVLPAYSARVMWLGAIGDHARALSVGRAALAVADRTGYVAWAVYRLIPAIAEAALALDDRDTIAEMGTRLTRDSALLAHTVGRGWASVVEGDLAHRAGSLDAAIAAFQQAIAILEAVPFPFDAARARLRLSRVLQAHGEPDEAAQEARAALQVFESLGARPAVDEARALLRTMGARLPTRRITPGIDGLTGREQEIVRLIARRLSNKEIGVRLDISARTVGTHLANVFDKVGIRDRTALGDLAREQGLHRDG
ncbi:MAG: AAA family ATPase [Gemmatimonadaceae bacterium]|nr:AAA family ATPase [Gemmatimonadaceae bacterium]